MSKQLSTLAHKIDSCIFKSYTKDLPRLRYNGPIHVLIIDDTSTYQNMNRMGLLDGHDWETVSYQATTITHYLPFIAKRDKASFCVNPYSSNWLKNSTEEVGPLVGMNPLPVHGKLIRCNLKTIKALDLHYRNGVAHRRIKVAIRTPLSKGSVNSAWVYFTPETSFMRWDPHTNGYAPMSGMSIEPFNKDLSEGIYRIPYSFVTVKGGTQ